MAKVKFGLSNVHFFPLTESESQGVISMSYGTAINCPGAVNLSLDVTDSEAEPFYADDSIYYMPAPKAGGYSGTLELALIPDELKQKLMNYKEDEDDVMIEIAEGKTLYAGMTFEIDTDDKARKLVYYKVQLGTPALAAATTEASKTPATDTLPITVLPTNKEFTFGTGTDAVVSTVVSGYTTADSDATVYSGWHSTPHLPSEPTPPTPPNTEEEGEEEGENDGVG